MPIPNWAAEQMQANVNKLKDQQAEANKMVEFYRAVNELMRDFNVSTSERIQFINAVGQSARKILM